MHRRWCICRFLGNDKPQGILKNKHFLKYQGWCDFGHGQRYVGNDKRDWKT